MKYRKPSPFGGLNIAISLSLSKKREKELDDLINRSFYEAGHGEEISIDDVNFFVAPHIQTAEEAFYVASLVNHHFYLVSTGQLD